MTEVAEEDGARLDAWLAFALACCDAADALALEHFRRDLVIEAKPDRTFVTQADQAIERMIRQRISTAYPGHGIVGEEYGTEAGSGRLRWYVDPIDGTHNFIRGVPLFGVLLGQATERESRFPVRFRRSISRCDSRNGRSDRRCCSR